MAITFIKIGESIHIDRQRLLFTILINSNKGLIIFSKKVDWWGAEGGYISRSDHDRRILPGRGSSVAPCLGHWPETGRGGWTKHLAPHA